MLLTDLLLALAGFLAGAVGGVIGVGGGIIFVPALTIGLGLPQTVAQGTSLAAMLGAVGAAAGALLALALPTGVLVRVFGVFLLLSAWRLWRG